jgi:hypothetical protein
VKLLANQKAANDPSSATRRHRTLSTPETLWQNSNAIAGFAAAHG